MLVDVKEEKAKKKSRKRKEEKEEKTGLDILLDYSPRNSGEQKNDEEGDVRDILIIRRDIRWEIGLSIKHNRH